eukprot:173916-Pyramimonas_sp.AAC.1
MWPLTEPLWQHLRRAHRRSFAQSSGRRGDAQHSSQTFTAARDPLPSTAQTTRHQTPTIAL